MWIGSPFMAILKTVGMDTNSVFCHNNGIHNFNDLHDAHCFNSGNILLINDMKQQGLDTVPVAILSYNV